MRKRVWINPEFLNWYCFSEGGSIVNDVDNMRAYEIWEHALNRLQNNPSEMDRTDAITTLKRCLNQRLQLIEKYYKLRSNFGSNSKRYLQLLEELSLIRPLLLQGLMEIRNEIEHKDKRPPKLERCLELLDAVWYFLRTTDRIVQVISDSLLYQHNNDIHWISLEVIIKRKWHLYLRGWLPNELIASQSTSSFIEILADELHTNEKWKAKGEHLDKSDTDLYFSGEILKLPDRRKMAHQYFSAI